MIVLDASVVVEMLGHSGDSAVVGLRLAKTRLVHAPYLVDIEVASAIRRHCAMGALTAHRAQQAMDDFLDMRILRHRHTPHLRRIWELRENFTAYDACYLALTEALDATLLTRDTALASARLRRGNVEVI